MTTLAEEAAAAFAARQAAEQTTRDTERTAQRNAARDAVKQVLTRPDGTSINFGDVGLSNALADYDKGLFVWADNSGVGVAAQQTDDGWRVLLVRLVDGQWTRSSERLRTLADVGAVLAAG